MKLIKAHIINFGKIHNFVIDFESGVNSYIYENGWGKTTLSVFIKAMFYGMEHTTKSLENNELKKYLPWQGGLYGGSLTFSYNNKNYIVSRIFGKKKNEDTFELRDLTTNKISSDFSENLGIELFGVNKETYERSIHVTLEETPAGSSDISAKLNNLIENADVSNFDEAISNLKNKSKVLVAMKGKGGEIAQIQGRIDECREKLSEIDAKIFQNEEYEKKLVELSQDISEAKKKQNNLTDQLALNAKYESKLRYEQLKNDLEKAKQIKAELLAFFNGQLPNEETLEKIDRISSEFTTVESNIKNNSVTQSEKDQYEALKNYFAGDIPSKEKIDLCLKTDNDFKRFKQEENERKLTLQESEEYNSLKQKFSGTDISEEKINECVTNVSEVQDLKNEISRISSDIQSKKVDLKLSQQIKPKNAKRIIFLSIAFFALALDIAAFILKMNIVLSFSGAFFFVLFMILGLVSKNQGSDTSSLNNEIATLETKLSELSDKCSIKEKNYKAFISKFTEDSGSELSAINKISIEFNRYTTLIQKENNYNLWLKSQSKKQDDYESELKTFVRTFCKTEDITAVSASIQVLTEKLNRFSELSKKINVDSKNIDSQKEMKEKLGDILSQYKTEKTLSFAEQVQEIHNKLNDIKNADELINSNYQKIADFEGNSENDIDFLVSLTKPEKSTEELQTSLSDVVNQINGLNADVANYQKIINDNLSETEKKEDIENEIESLSKRKQDKSEEYNILLKTQEFLTKAKEQLDANYSDPMKENFAKYVKMMGGNLNLVIDTDLKVSLDENGMLRESEFLSEGYKDIVNFCSRMALIDALFKEEKPTVILDDPFVNLDDDKIPKALQLVRNMSKEKQVLYFACHKSREI
ncbi:MAG: AAA family ATPase [Treponema sp.]|uniref:AAA family ATPase n=1 Tax=Treponema sp. TaxID=166 RepID=UPI0025CDBEA5|nr:AAA family ATPase [Treponema sp.]MBQ9281814.1 AAA family ATPase [Treponema sp.]